MSKRPKYPAPVAEAIRGIRANALPGRTMVYDRRAEWGGVEVKQNGATYLVTADGRILRQDHEGEVRQMAKDYAAEYAESASGRLNDFPDLGWKIEPSDFGPRGAIYTWRLVDYRNARVIRESSNKMLLYGMAEGVRWARTHDGDPSL